MNKPVGYLLNHGDGLKGERGVYYDYILAANGIFIEAENVLLKARIQIAECDIRGLHPINTRLSLTYGSIPQRFFDLALDTFLSDISVEHYVAVTVNNGYHFYVPLQDKSSAGITYEAGEKVILELHSHGKMKVGFSTIDNADETGLKIYGIVGELDTTPVVSLRVGVYGYFNEIAWSDVFDGILYGAVETKREEVIIEDALYNLDKDDSGEIKDHYSWLRRHWKFCR